MKYGQIGTEPHTTPCIHVARTIPIFIKFIYKAFCMNMVYFTPKVPNLYMLRCRQLDGGIKLLDHFDTFKKWQILVGRWQNFTNCHGFYSQRVKQKEK